MDNHPHPRKRFMTQLCTLHCLLSHKTIANPIKNLAESLPHLFRPEASCRDNSLGTGSLKPALGQKQFAGLLIFIHSHLPAQPQRALRHRASNDFVQCAGPSAELPGPGFYKCCCLRLTEIICVSSFVCIGGGCVGEGGVGEGGEGEPWKPASFSPGEWLGVAPGIGAVTAALRTYPGLWQNQGQEVQIFGVPFTCLPPGTQTLGHLESEQQSG